jgi:hypothetical protein
VTSQPVLRAQYVNKYRPQDYHVSCDLHTEWKVLTLQNIDCELNEPSAGQQQRALALTVAASYRYGSPVCRMSLQ